MDKILDLTRHAFEDIGALSDRWTREPPDEYGYEERRMNKFVRNRKAWRDHLRAEVSMMRGDYLFQFQEWALAFLHEGARTSKPYNKHSRSFGVKGWRSSPAISDAQRLRTIRQWRNVQAVHYSTK